MDHRLTVTVTIQSEANSISDTAPDGQSIVARSQWSIPQGQGDAGAGHVGGGQVGGIEDVVRCVELPVGAASRTSQAFSGSLG